MANRHAHIHRREDGLRQSVHEESRSCTCPHVFLCFGKEKKKTTKNNSLQHTFYFFFLANIRWCGRHVLVRAMMPQRHSHVDVNLLCVPLSCRGPRGRRRGGRGYGSAPVHNVNGNHYNGRVQIVVSFYVRRFVEKENLRGGLNRNFILDNFFFLFVFIFRAWRRRQQKLNPIFGFIIFLVVFMATYY